ncbi:Aste57867_8706 [Aphanomyces stellatus]|uniref:Aste57867_8706 protein n=1 Tax=Aphanomyces stellatus TaxID=120398 RepID=A0A485KKZ5_9STRA|nr:hypothetical protein As57867_008672 [Aphanomyces stellatus]VFT85592.1 Aste57867_8706 [Aphanomyces stellatus]
MRRWCVAILAVLGRCLFAQDSVTLCSSITVYYTNVSSPYVAHDVVHDGASFDRVEFDNVAGGDVLVLIVYSLPSLQGNRSFVVNTTTTSTMYFDTRDQRVQSFQVVALPTFLATLRQDSNGTDSVVLLTQPIVDWGVSTPSSSPFLHVHVLGANASVTNLSMVVHTLDIPPTLLVQAFRLPDFSSPSNVWTTETSLPSHMRMQSLRVWPASAVSVLPPVDLAVAFYGPQAIVHFAGQVAHAGVLVVHPGQHIASALFLRGRFRVGFSDVDVSPGLALVWYPELGFRGPPTVVRRSASTDNMDWLPVMQSFRVGLEADLVPMNTSTVPPPLTSRGRNAVVVTCDVTTTHSLYFVPDVAYPLLDASICKNLSMPPGVAVLAYDRPWLLGSFKLWTASVFRTTRSPNPYGPLASYPMQSLRVVATPLSPHMAAQAEDDASIRTTSTIFYKTKMYEPAVNVWSQQVSAVAVTAAISSAPEGCIGAVYEEYNFQGRYVPILLNRSSAAPSDFIGFKSFVLWPANDDTKLIPPLFVGCFPIDDELNLTPIFMQAGDNISDLIYPWGGRIFRFTIPSGLVVVAFSQTNFEGPAAVWTADVVLNASWNGSVMSLQVRDASNMALPNNATVITSSSLSHGWMIALSGIGMAVLLAIASVVLVQKRRCRHSFIKGTVHVDDDDNTVDDYDYSSLRWHDMDLVKLHHPNLPLTERLASGASGEIFLGTFQGHLVAIKTLRTSPSPPQVQAFIDEILLFDRVQSPYIVKLIGAAWTHPSNVQAIMEYMNLGDLRHHLAKTGRYNFAWPDKLQCAQRIAHALFCLHSQDMIHRDLKSRNVLLDTDKGAKLADFGASKQMLFGDTMTVGVGTYQWMAPEMMLFQAYTSAVDIYSFGVLLSELDTHQLPYANERSDDTIARRVIHEGLRPSFGCDCPDWFRALAMQCMAPDATDRPSATQIMFLLETQMTGSP